MDNQGIIFFIFNINIKIILNNLYKEIPLILVSKFKNWAQEFILMIRNSQEQLKSIQDLPLPL